jgi:hypothetical protein
MKANTYDAKVNKNINLEGVPKEVKVEFDNSGFYQESGKPEEGTTPV